MAVNKVILLGNVGKDPQIRDGNGQKFATFSLATTDKSYTKRDGTVMPERTEWHSIVANGNIVQVIERYVKAGTKLYIEGKLRTRKYTARDNTERQVTEVYVDSMELLGSKQESNPNVPFANQQYSQQNNSNNPPY
ncbi:MAG: single-stranded DNA-binding protein [Bacteroidales bacterium]|nr:single-stranded DNA-binding protein [Bacteroidales bacterium]